MKFFRQSSQQDGWRAISFQEGEVRVAHVRRAASLRPLVTMVGAELLNGATPGEALGRLSKEWQGQRFVCTTAVQPSGYQFLPVEAPNVPANELKSALAWTITELIDFSNAEATIDVLSVPKSADSTARSRSMYAIVIRTQLATDIQRCFQDARLTLKVIDIPEMAQRNVATLLEADGRGIALVSFDATGGLLTFTSGGELYLARRIDVSLSQLLKGEPAQREHHAERVALEIQRSLDHFAREFNWVTLARLVIAPLGVDATGLVGYLSANLGITVEALDMATILDLSQVPELTNVQAQHQYFMALGLALRLEEKVL